MRKGIELIMWTFLRAIRMFRFKGKGQLVTLLKPSDPIGNSTVVCRGILFNLNLDDDLQYEIYHNAFGRRDLPKFLDLVSEGEVCIDAGANIGFFSLHLAKSVGATGKIYAFEPDPDNVQRLRNNVSLNHYSERIEIYEVALSDHVGNVKFYKTSQQHSGWGSLVQYKDLESKTIYAATTTLDDFILEKKIKKVVLLKIDVEGNEINLLAGAKNSIKDHLFKYIAIEYNGKRLIENGCTFKRFAEMFRDSGYIPTKFNSKIYEKMTHEVLDPVSVTTNFIFTPVKKYS